MQLIYKIPTMRRTTFLRGILILVLVLFTLRLFYVQVIRHDYYAKRAYQTQVSKLTIVPERGTVFALDGDKPVPLVLNETIFTAFADPKEIVDKQKVVQALRAVAGGNVVKDFETQLDSKKLRYVVMARQLTRTQAEKLRQKNLAGVGLQKGTQRVYPEGSLGAQMLGYVNNEGIGQYGLEGAINTRLAGTPGQLETVTDVRQIPLTIGQSDTNTPAVNGDDVVLTIDRNIQQKAEDILKSGLEKAKATRGSVIVMDPRNGRVMAMANLPTYDPSKYNEVDDYRTFQNSVVSNPYEAGSVIKVLSMGAGIDSGAVSVNSTFNNTGQISVDGIIIRNVEEDPIFPGTTMTDVLHYSLNTGVVYVLEQMGGGSVNKQARETLYDYYTNRYRFGRLTGIEQAGEVEGTIVGPNTGVGRNVKYANMTFGQGMDVTMIQTAAAFSAAMNGGTYYQPTLIRGVMNDDGKLVDNPAKVVSTGVLTPEHSAQLMEMTYQGRKQGFFGNVDPAGYKVGGKTGTSQILNAAGTGYIDENSIGSYLGFGGTDEPRYVIMVRVDDSKLVGGYAGTIAAGPIFNELSNWMLKYLELPPQT